MKFLRFLVHKQQLVEAGRLFRSGRVPVWLKITAVGLALLIVSPINVLGDIPFLGLIDDVALMGLLLGWFVRSATVHDDPLTIESA